MKKNHFKLRLFRVIIFLAFILITPSLYSQSDSDIERATRETDRLGRKEMIKEDAQTKEANASEKTVSGEKPEEQAATKETVEINPEIIEKTMPAYRLNLKQLVEEAERNIKRVEGEIVQAEILERNRAREAKVREHFEKGNQLYQEGRLKEARQEWQRALEISQDPEMKNYIRESEKRAREEEKKQREEQARLEKERLEKEQQARIEAEKQEKARLLAEKKAREEKLAAERHAQEESRKARLEAEQKAKEENASALVEQKEKERLERERQKQLKQEQKETERQKKEEELAKQKAEQQQRLAEEKAKKEQELKSRQEELARQKEKQLKQIAEEKARRKQEGKETKLKEQRK